MGVTWYCILRETYVTVVGWGCKRDGGNKKHVLNFGIVTSWKDIRWRMKMKELARCIKTDVFYRVTLGANAGHDLLILEVSRSHTATCHRR
jgi:hypothetical protein